MAFIIWKKIPMLNDPSIVIDTNKKSFLFRLKEKIVCCPFFKKFTLTKILLMILSKIRVFILKIENKISNYLQSLRQKAHKKNK